MAEIRHYHQLNTCIYMNVKASLLAFFACHLPLLYLFIIIHE
uniref:Putative 2-aminoethanethiol dioxygenase isoform X1 n=1 Tax=Rhizophora mucronata TaxID=61149 RepID=A0A2P2QWZ3_RHIMU